MNRGRLRADMQQQAMWWKATPDETTCDSLASRSVDPHTFMRQTKGCIRQDVSSELTNYYRDGSLIGQVSSRSLSDVSFLLLD